MFIPSRRAAKACGCASGLEQWEREVVRNLRPTPVYILPRASQPCFGRGRLSFPGVPCADKYAHSVIPARLCSVLACVFRLPTRAGDAPTTKRHAARRSDQHPRSEARQHAAQDRRFRALPRRRRTHL